MTPVMDLTAPETISAVSHTADHLRGVVMVRGDE
jgi:hypothetical protein